MNEIINTQKNREIELTESEFDKSDDSTGRDTTISCSSNQTDACVLLRIQGHYDYWEKFIFYWLHGLPITDLGWHNPNDIPLLNSLYRQHGPGPDYSSYYLPEPWWGWRNDKSKPLHSVVINFNPGEGGCAQERWPISQVYVGSYSRDIVNNKSVLPQTRAWHENKRATPILNSLNRIGAITTHNGLENHISIELLPWHTASASSNPGYWFYLEQNIKEVFNHCISFAADLSRIIVNNKLKKTVVLRISASTTEKLKNYLAKIGIDVEFIPQASANKNSFPNNDIRHYISTIGNGNYLKFKIKQIKDITFVCIWGTHSRNRFPPDNILDQIMKKI